MKRSLTKSALVLATLIAVVCMFSISYAGEQTITDEVALDIFGSLGNENMWQLKCKGDDSSDIIFSGRDGQQILIQYHAGGYDKGRMRVTRNGKTLTVDYVINMGELAGFVPVSVRLEIVSRNLVRMFGKKEFARTQYYAAGSLNYSCDFVRK